MASISPKLGFCCPQASKLSHMEDFCAVFACADVPPHWDKLPRCRPSQVFFLLLLFCCLGARSCDEEEEEEEGEAYVHRCCGQTLPHHFFPTNTYFRCSDPTSSASPTQYKGFRRHCDVNPPLPRPPSPPRAGQTIECTLLALFPL